MHHFRKFNTDGAYLIHYNMVYIFIFLEYRLYIILNFQILM